MRATFAHADHPARGVRLQDHVGKLVGVGQAAQRGHGELEDLPLGHGRLADLAGGHLGVLLLDGRHHVAGREIAGGHLLGIEPEPHAVVPLAEIGDVAHAGQPGQLVAQLDRGVVAQVEVVAGPVGIARHRRREQVHDHQHVGRLLLDHDPLAVDQIGEDRLGHGHAVLHQDLSHVQVDAQLEGDGQRVRAVVGALGGHVEHPLDAVDLLLDGGGHGVGHDLGVRAGIRGGDLDGGRGNLRILRHRQRPHGDPARQCDNDRQHRGEDRAMDEEA